MFWAIKNAKPEPIAILIDIRSEKFVEKNNNLERDDQDFEFNQDIDSDNENFRSPGWIGYQKRLKLSLKN